MDYSFLVQVFLFPILNILLYIGFMYFVQKLWGFPKKFLWFCSVMMIVYLSIFGIRVYMNEPLFSDEFWWSWLSPWIILSMGYVVGRVFADIGKKWSDKVAKGIVIFYAMLCAFFPVSSLAYYVMTGKLLTSFAILMVFQSNLQEVMEFLNIKFTFLLIIIPIFVFFIVYKYFSDFKVTYRFTKYSPLVSAGVLIALFMLNSFWLFTRCYPVAVFVNACNVMTEYGKYQGESLKRKEKNLHFTLKDDKKRLVVLVIGESANRKYMSSYGYKKDTTPWLKSMTKSNNTFLFPNAYSSQVYTIGALTYALTNCSQYNDVKFEDSLSLIETAKYAGYKTYFISNQYKFSFWDMPVTQICDMADVSVWLNDCVGAKFDYISSDKVILNEMKKLQVPEDENVFVVIHLMGSHFEYKRRYPKEFSVFGEDEVSTYENSLLYTDYVLSELYNKFSKSKNFASFIYMSDHGNDLYLSYHIAHSKDCFTWPMTYIPFVIMFSDSYIKDNQDICDALRKNLKSYWTNDLLYFTVCNLLRINDIPSYESQWDISTTDYKGTIDNLYTGSNLFKDIEAFSQTVLWIRKLTEDPHIEP